MAPRKHKRAAQRTKLGPHDPTGAVPLIRTETILSPAGDVIRTPTAIRAEWDDPTDMDRSKRRARTISGYRRADTLLGLQKRANGKITERHIAAADRLRDAYQLGVEGARPGQGRSIVPDVLPTAFTSGNYLQHHDRLGPLRDYKRAIGAVGPSLAGILVHVLVHNLTLSAWAAQQKAVAGAELSEHDCRGYLIAALDALVDHFFPTRGRT